MLFESFATTSVFWYETEDSTPLSADISVGNDTQASAGGAYMKFGPGSAIPDDAYVVSLQGNDNNSGDIQSPWRTIKKGLSSIGPGDTLYIRGGAYIERIKSSIGTFHVTPGISNSPVIV